ncbi:MAG: glycosyltransferase family 4 protein [Anaerolineae bacterium]|nr:glycosyltransferase family 4 protein [Anaerolineae bacterium]MCI0611137.1 glycosyltransferase family 4 protein [Anaerolineae bacterium]
MKIALLSEKYTPDIGGLAISTERFARLLSSAGHMVRVIAPTSNLPPSEKRILTNNEVSVTRFGAHKRVDDTLVDWFELIVEEHHRNSFDVLHAYFLTQAGFVATYAGKYLNVPSVISIRGNDIERAAFDPAKFSHVMYALQNASAITTNTSELVNKAKAFFDREIILIPNAIDTEHFKQMPRNEELAKVIGLIEEGKKKEERLSAVGFAGELREKKGLKVLLSAYAQVNKKLPSALLIVGEVRAGEDKQFVDEFLVSNPDSRIIITGFVSPTDLPAYYCLMDVFVHASLRDGMPNALLEAMACEKPVIATPIGGMLDVVKDGENGIFVPVNDGDALANAINEILNNPELQSRLGKAARQSIINCFSQQKELAGNLDVYRKLGLNP